MAKPSAARISVTRPISSRELRWLSACCAAKVERVSIGGRAETALREGGGTTRSAQAEIDRGDRGRLGLRLEELALGEPEGPGEEPVREDLDGVVVVEDAGVVVLAAERDLVLGRGDLFLERQDVLVRLELRVVFD